MAAIDKIYLNKFEQYEAFKNWCKEQPPILDKYGKPGYLTWYLYDWDKELFTQSHPFMALEKIFTKMETSCWN